MRGPGRGDDFHGLQDGVADVHEDALAVAGAFTARARATPWWLWAIPVLLAASVVFITLETPRYRTGVEPFVILLAALALCAAAAGRRSAA